ncbi:FAD-binding oxidoreductase [Zavarzinia sp. CC-PAN008]|uniref:FAD-binding oxidoreductase n=1 Tax=Zavarzinia sp. CC-PAN008 TaxID=3243332 RepID=UPI003F74429E
MDRMDDTLLADLHAVLGDRGLLTNAADTAPFLLDHRRRYRGRARAVCLPASTAEAAAVVQRCARARVAIVPQGGNTGLCGGATPYEDADAVVIGLGRMNRIRALDPSGGHVVVEAGCILANLRQAASEAGCLFPVGLGSEGSAQIGGLVSTNAGGTQVIRYGTMREQVLGLEVVLADGRVWDGLRTLRKDNTGYDLKQLFVGAEGTLGLVTAVALRLRPQPAHLATAMVQLAEPQDAVRLLDALRRDVGEGVGTFELIPAFALDLVLRHIPGTRAPFVQPSPWYALVEILEPPSRLEELLGAALEDGLVTDAVIAQNTAEAAALWRLRESISPAQVVEGASLKHDVSVPVAAMPRFIEEASAAVVAACPGLRVCAFGHLGDGNVHFNLQQPAGTDPDAFLARGPDLAQIVHDLVVQRFGGSISAEHGLGRLKLDEVTRYKAPLELELMVRVKQALDPVGLFNPGKVIRAP